MSLITRLAACAAAVPLLVATAGTATAGTSWTYKSSGVTASTSWLEVGPIPGVAGNAHVGYLSAQGDRVVDVFGEVYDWTCPDGVLPPDGGGHGEEPETECALENVRFVYAQPGAVTLTVDKKLAKARLTGVLDVSDHDGGSAGRPPVDITWTGIGSSSTERSYSTFTENGTRYRSRYTATTREGDVEGRIGAMVFDDEAGETSYGAFGTYRTDERAMTR
ncbi:hypothetical protein [Phycicoccus flavus]|uniref:hypothetical protein n=1 Tax=Phycicoccus flavus TaxID=2502783 RepID=UPI000FEC0325|nr:hypothetical protein [Phycicoccus flavus]NHA68432.1 hypothetical protein [Phycicoccus flavus]